MGGRWTTFVFWSTLLEAFGTNILPSGLVQGGSLGGRLALTIMPNWQGLGEFRPMCVVSGTEKLRVLSLDSMGIIPTSASAWTDLCNSVTKRLKVYLCELIFSIDPRDLYKNSAMASERYMILWRSGWNLE